MENLFWRLHFYSTQQTAFELFFTLTSHWSYCSAAIPQKVLLINLFRHLKIYQKFFPTYKGTSDVLQLFLKSYYSRNWSRGILEDYKKSEKNLIFSVITLNCIVWKLSCQFCSKISFLSFFSYRILLDWKSIKITLFVNFILLKKKRKLYIIDII